MRKPWVYLASGMLFGSLGFLAADFGQIRAFIIGFGLGLLIVFFAQAFPRATLPQDELDSLDAFDALDHMDRIERRR